MKYLLFVILTGLLTWPYYHRMKKYDCVKPFIALIPSSFVVLGFIYAVTYFQAHGTLSGIFDFKDLVANLTFIVIALSIAAFHCWMIFGSDAFQIDLSTFEGWAACSILGLGTALLFGVLSAYPIVLTVLSLS